MIPSPTPSLSPADAAAAQQMLSNIQHHQLTANQMFFAFVAFTNSLPLSWKFAIYHFLNALPLPQIPIWLMVVLYFFGPFILIGIVYWAIKYFPRLIQALASIISFAASLFSKPSEDLTMLELTFPHDTNKSAYATEQLYKALHSLSQKPRSLKERLVGRKQTFSLEIVANGDRKIRFICIIPKHDADTIHRTLLSFLPGIQVREIQDYLPIENNDLVTNTRVWWNFRELTLSNTFAFPIAPQKTLMEHDPIAYITGNMTKLKKGEFMVMQLVATSVSKSTHRSLMNRVNEMLSVIEAQGELYDLLHPHGAIHYLIFSPFYVVKFFVLLTLDVLLSPLWIPIFIVTFGRTRLFPFLNPNKPYKRISLTPKQQEKYQAINGKINQDLFETSIRFFTVTQTSQDNQRRMDGLRAALSGFSSPYQSLIGKGDSFSLSKINNYLNFHRLKYRLLSLRENPILSSSELADLYHIPNMDLVQIEGIAKAKSNVLPIPSSMTQEDTEFDVIVGQNSYGGETVPIGITREQRRRHMYVIGKSGMGKTTMVTSMIYQDMVNGNGLCVLDPHGDMFRTLVKLVPVERQKDIVVFDPSDREYPLGINILSPGITFQNIDDEHEWITSSVLAIFAKLTAKEYWGPRMEHILRSATLTALKTPHPTLFTLQRLLTDKKYQKHVAVTLKDPVLKQFWQKEFALMGNMQLSSVTAPLTQRLGHFITATMSRNILMQQISTINIQHIMDEGKILLVNLSKGDLGEDQSFFFGTIITSLIWMAAYQRTKIPEEKRKDFFLYVDEFQNFATPRFAEITSEGRKFRVSLTASHQNIAQVEDPNILKVVAGNANSIVALKASPADETFILPFMEPEVKKGDIVNLAPYHFFMKVTTDESEDAFTGATVPLDVEESETTAEDVISYSRIHYGTQRKTVEAYLEKLFVEDKPKPKKAKEVESIKETGTAITDTQKEDNKNIKDKTTMAKKPERKK